MKFLLVIMSLLIGTANAADCLKVVSIEGLAQGKHGPVSKMLETFEKQLPEGQCISVVHHEWNDNIVLKNYSEKPLLIVGHSLGGEKALKVARKDDYVVTIDARPNNLGSWLDSFLRFEMPFVVDGSFVVVNIYERGFWLPGQRVVSKNENRPVINIKITDGTDHINMPLNPKVIDYMHAVSLSLIGNKLN